MENTPNSFCELFLQEAQAAGLHLLPHDDDSYIIAVPDGEFTLGIDNIRRDFLRDGDREAVKKFLINIKKIVDKKVGDKAPWSECQSRIFLSLEVSGTLHAKLRSRIKRVHERSYIQGSGVDR